MTDKYIYNLPEPLGGTPPKGSVPSFTDYDYELKYRRAFEIVLWSIPAVELYGFYRGIKAVGGGPNVVIAWSKLATSKAELLTANNTTPYIFAMTDLRQGPVVIDVPAATDKASLYGQIVDHWQMTIADVGPIGEDKGKGGKYLLLPPGYDGKIPEGYFVLNSPSYRVYFVFRSIRGKGASVEDAYAYAKTMQMHYLDDPAPTQFIDPSDMRFPSLARFDERWFEDLYEIFTVEEIDPQDKIMNYYLYTLGIERGKPFKPDEETIKAMRQAAIDAYHYLHHRATYAEEARVYWSDRHWLNILVPDKNGLFSFVYDDMIDIDRRAEMRYLGTFYPRGLPKTPATMYLYTFVDKNGKPIESGKTYKLTVPADVPVKQFWALIVYDMETMAFIYTREGKIGISSYDVPNLTKNDDGSVTLYFGPFAPDGLEDNWIPTSCKTPFPVMRFYGPEDAFLEKKWALPDVELA
jgi:hypothetical protein